MMSTSEQTTVDEVQDEDTLALDAAGEVRLPVVDVLRGRAFLTGKAGSGKSNSASVILEELLDRGHAAVVIDTDGEYWGLKEDYEILHVGADEECEFRVGPEHADRLASLALDQNVPIVLDVSGYLDADERDAVVREMARALFDREKEAQRPFPLVVEECHEFVPEGSLGDVGEMLIRVAKRGRKRGLGIIGVSQRPADVKKDFITQCDWLLWHRLTWENDTKVVKRVVGKSHAEGVQDLDDGEGFLMADFLDEDVTEVQVRRKRTFDAGAAPGLDNADRPDLKTVDGGLLDELEEISDEHQQRQDRIAQLEAQIEEREETIAELRDELEQAQDMSDMAEQFTQAMLQAGGEGGGEAIQQKVEEIREEKNARIAELEQENESLQDELRDEREERSALEGRVAELEEYEQAVENMDELREAVARMNDALGIESGEADERLRQRIGSLEEDLDDARTENERLQERLEESGGVSISSDYHDFVQEDVVLEAIADAKENASSCSPRYVKGVVATILEEGEPTDYETIAEYLGVSTTTDVSKAAAALEARGVIRKVEQSPAVVDFDLEGAAEIKERMQRRERAEAVMEEL